MNFPKHYLIFVSTLIIVFFFVLFTPKNSVFAQSTCALNEYEGMRPFNLTQTTNLYIGNCLFPNLQAYYDGTRTAYFLVGGQSLPLQQEIDFSCWTGGHPRATTPCYFGPDSLFIIRNPMEMVGGHQAEDKVIDYIAANKKVRIQLSPSTEPNNKQTFDDFPATNCVKLSGSGPKKIVFMRNNTSSLGVSDFVSKMNDVMNNAFAKTDPWKTYFDKLSFYIDLKTHNVNGSSSLKDINNISSCKGDTPLLYLIFGNSASSGFDGHVSDIPYFRTEPDYLELSVHEAGHAVGHLWDASQCQVMLEKAQFRHKSVLEANCTKTNSNFRYNNIWYGGKDIGYEDTNSEGVKVHWFIPTRKNLMMHPPDNTKYYDVISCGFLVAAIVDQPVGDSGWTNVDWAHAQKYWPECMKMDTVKDGIPPVNPAPTIRATPP
ncbi:MAG: hypothetical protein WCW03_00595 [Candidatus Paceibacterota bacterium]|jgi:hypothetical protein